MQLRRVVGDVYLCWLMLVKLISALDWCCNQVKNGLCTFILTLQCHCPIPICSYFSGHVCFQEEERIKFHMALNSRARPACFSHEFSLRNVQNMRRINDSVLGQVCTITHWLQELLKQTHYVHDSYYLHFSFHISKLETWLFSSVLSSASVSSGFMVLYKYYIIIIIFFLSPGSIDLGV